MKSYYVYSRLHYRVCVGTPVYSVHLYTLPNTPMHSAFTRTHTPLTMAYFRCRQGNSRIQQSWREPCRPAPPYILSSILPNSRYASGHGGSLNALATPANAVSASGAGGMGSGLGPGHYFTEGSSVSLDVFLFPSLCISMCGTKRNHLFHPAIMTHWSVTNWAFFCGRYITADVPMEACVCPCAYVRTHPCMYPSMHVPTHLHVYTRPF